MLGYSVEMRISLNKDKTTSLAMCVVKLKTGLSVGQLGALFNLNLIWHKRPEAVVIYAI